MGKELSQEFHPVKSGCSVALGDYGYFDKQTGAWRRLGNICDIPGMRFHPKTQVSNNRYDTILQQGVSMKAAANAEAGIDNAQAKCSVSFGKDQSYYVRGEICELKEFSSVAIEIKDQIDKMKLKGNWAPDYCVIVAVIYSSNFFGLFACNSGAKVDLSANVDSNIPFHEIDAKVGLVGNMNQSSVEFVNKLNDGNVAPIGFKTVMLKAGCFGLGRPTIKYVGDSDDFSDPQDEGMEFPEGPLVYDS